MELMQLRYFRAIAEMGNITAAAKKLGVAQSTLTSAVKRLEEGLETTLLLRTSRGVEVTATGRALATAADDVTEVLDAAKQRIAGLERGDVGRFVVGCHESLGAYFLPGFLPGFLAAYPGIEIGVWNGTSAGVREAVLSREAHFGLVVAPVPHDDLVMVEAFRDSVAIVGRRDGLGAPASRETVEARLRAHPLIYADRVHQCRQIVDELANAQLLPERCLTTGDLELTKSLILAGVGVGILPRRVAAYGHTNDLCVVHPSLPQVPDRVLLCFRADTHRTTAWQSTKRALLQHAEDIAVIPLQPAP